MIRIALILFQLAVCLPAASFAVQEPPAAPAGERASQPVPLVVWNRQIAEFRVAYDDWDSAERASRAVARILAVPAEQGSWTVAYRPEQAAGQSASYFTINGEFAFRLLERDVDSERGTTLAQASEGAAAKLREVMESRVEQTRWQSILRGVLVSLALTVLLFGALIGSARLWRSIQARFVPVLSLAGRRAVIGGINLWPILGALRQLLARALVWSVAGFLVYGWLALVLEQFPYTEPWGDTLGGFVVRMLSGFFWGVLASVPDLFAVAVILALAHAFARGVGAYFLEVERGNVKVSWLAEETARATRQLLTILTWVFAVVVAYPYIPGSDTDAFKGVTVFLGLMISLGSAGLVNQIMSGLTVIYSHAYRRGDYVRIGAHEGRVHQIGLLATKLTTPAGEIVSVPNAVVTANTAVDYSPSEPGAPELLTSAVTIGYDAPWRQVHALLQLAAERTPGLVRDPAPFVLQRALSDFYVEYQLVARLAWREDRPAALSRLLGEIQDAFNQHGVQIMSPHFTTQPQERVVVPRGAWYSPPAAGG